MKGLSILAVTVLLNAGLANAGDGPGTNSVTGQVQNLLDAHGFTFEQEAFSLPKRDIHSLRNLHFIERGPFIPLVVPDKKPGWSLWNNSSFKSLGRNYDQISMFAPYGVLAQYEYDISYTIDF